MFIDYYEILEISPNADSDTIDRVFRHLAMRYHPDNQATGDLDRFTEIVEAHGALRDPVKRALYDIRYNQQSQSSQDSAEDSVKIKGIHRDVDVQDKLLSILYVKRRQNVGNPGLSNFELERFSECPPEHLEFHLWYLREKGWISRLENGLLAITVAGVDRAKSENHHETAKLLTDRHQSE